MQKTLCGNGQILDDGVLSKKRAPKKTVLVDLLT
jgi:hypothetical protein